MDSLTDTFSALADPTRRAILARLAKGSATVNELAEPFPISLPAISRHLKVLERANLIVRETEAQKRRCRLQPENLRTAADWIESHAQFWTESLDRLTNYLDTTETRGDQSNEHDSHRGDSGTSDGTTRRK